MQNTNKKEAFVTGVSVDIDAILAEERTPHNRLPIAQYLTRSDMPARPRSGTVRIFEYLNKKDAEPAYSSSGQ